MLALLLGLAGCSASGRPDSASRPASRGGVPAAAPAPSPTESHPVEPRRFRTATGTVESYDPASRVLVVESAGGEASFVVAPEARLWIGSRRAAVERLATSRGAQVTVAWSEAAGRPTTHTVRLARGRGDRER